MLFFFTICNALNGFLLNSDTAKSKSDFCVLIFLNALNKSNFEIKVVVGYIQK